jgi:predicted ATP-grasp superfamily ATP-dependent carboligase
MDVHLEADVGLKRPLGVVAFPTTGLAGVIAAHLFVRRFGLERVGHVRSLRVAPTVLVRDGEWVPPVAVYAGKAHIRLGLRCDGLLLVVGHTRLERETYWDMASLLMDFFGQRQVPLAVAMRAQVAGGNGHPVALRALAEGARAEKARASLRLEPLGDGIVRGVSGALLIEARRLGRDMLVIVAESRRGQRDHEAAAGLAQVFSPPGSTAGGSLDGEAARIEEEILRSQQVTQWTEAHARDTLSRMYH